MLYFVARDKGLWAREKEFLCMQYLCSNKNSEDLFDKRGLWKWREDSNEAVINSEPE
jgi:hypothetical protein